MEYVKKECGSYNLHMIKTDKFKSTTIQVVFGTELKKETLTKINFLSSMITYTTKKYPTKIALSRKLEELYAAKLGMDCYRMGSNHNLYITLTVLDDKYTEKGLFNQGLDLLKEIIFNPNVTNGEFDETSFNVARNNIVSNIERIKENPRKYSIAKLYENVDKDAKYALNMDGYIEDVEKIDRKNLYDFYKEFIDSSVIDFFVVGNIDFDDIYKKITDKFKFKDTKRVETNFLIPDKLHNKKLKEVFEKDDTSQAKLSIACTVEGLTDFERKYVINIYNSILGGSPDSKFFKNIREKHSLCYYVSSSGSKLYNIMLIASGIEKDKYSQMIKLIKKEMEDMRKGLFSEEDIDKAKKYAISLLEEIEDSSTQIISIYYANDKLGYEPIEERIKLFQKITKEDIVNIANKIFLDTTFTLGGDKR